MVGDSDAAKASSPTRPAKDIGDAAMQWVRTRRARMVLLTAILCMISLGLISMRNHEALSSRHYHLSSYYPWKRPSMPNNIDWSFKEPSDVALQLENGNVDHIPPKLVKTTPNFHLIMPSERDTDGFCKSMVSAMVLDYPPPTVVQLKSGHANEKQQEGILSDTLHYLSDAKLVKDTDLVLIVDAQETRFQLPADVIIAQYKQLLVDANERLLKRYGTGRGGRPKYHQTIVFGAEKMCEDDDMACKYAPLSILPAHLYGHATGQSITQTPAKFINSRMVMGPARDLRVLYEAALKKFQDQKSQSQTVQSVFATLFAEQQLSRDAFEVETKTSAARIKDFFQGKMSQSMARHRLDEAKTELYSFTKQEFSNFTKQEFSMGLDYTHTLFQPIVYTTSDELVQLTHDNATNLSNYTHRGADTSYLSLPAALSTAKPPFSRADFTKPSPSPNKGTPYTDNLSITLHLDNLPDRTVPWRALPLIQNTYTGAIPAILLEPSSSPAHLPPSADISWNAFWYTDYKRALLRAYFRAPQSSTGYHDALVGGDRAWDARGGRGGVWTPVKTWMAWGEVDGVCGSVEEMKAVFQDGKGVWLHEGEAGAEQVRLTLEMKAKQQAGG